MNKKYVFGVYSNIAEAEQVVDQIIQQGVPRDSIAVAGGDADDYHGTVEYISYSQLQEENPSDNRGFFARLFGYNQTSDPDSYDNIDFEQYEDSLSRNEVLVLVDQVFEAELTSFNPDIQPVGYGEVAYGETHVATTDVENNDIGVSETHLGETADYDPYYADEERADSPVETEVETENIRLHEEQVDAHTVKKDAGDVRITKDVVEETKTIEVPVEREEIRIHHKTPTGNEGQDEDAFVEEDIVIPLSEEEVVVDKETVVTDEVEIEKVTHTDTEEVTETTRREELDIEDDTDRL